MWNAVRDAVLEKEYTLSVPTHMEELNAQFYALAPQARSELVATMK